MTAQPVADSETEKTCRKCGEVKPRGLFPSNKKTPDGLSPWCRASQKTMKETRKAIYRDYHNQYERRRKRTLLEAERVLKEKELEEERRLAAKQVGGALSAAYADLRRMLVSLDGALVEAQQREVTGTLRDALGYAYKVEDCLGTSAF